MDKQTILKKLGEYFASRKDVAFAYLFGSVAKDKSHSESDVDIGVYFTPQSRALEYESVNRYPAESQIWSDLDQIIGRHTDMVVLNRVPSTLFSAVLEEGNKIFSNNDGLLYRLSSAVNDLAIDFRNFVTDFVLIKERSRSMLSNNPTKLYC